MCVCNGNVMNIELLQYGRTLYGAKQESTAICYLF